MTDPDGAITLAVSGLVTYLVHSTLVVGAVWASVTLTRAGARTRDVAWKCALCLPLATTTAHIVWPERALARRYEVEVPMLREVAVASAEVKRPSPRAMRAGLSAPEPDSAARAALATADVVPSARPGRSSARANDAPRAHQEAANGVTGDTRRPSLAQVRSLATVGVALIVCCLLLGPQIRLAWFLRRRRPLTTGLIAEALADLLPRARAKRGAAGNVRLSVSDVLVSPIALGVLRPEIVVPRRALTELSRPLARALVAHELAHHARRDPLWTWLAHTLTTLFAVQPMNRIARRELVATAELMADDLAVAWTHDGVGLAQCLAEVASWLGPRDRSVPALAMVRARDSHGLRRRVERALERPLERETRGFGPLAIVVGGVVALAAPGLALVAREPRGVAPVETLPAPRAVNALRAPAAPLEASAPLALAALEQQLAATRRELLLLEGARDPDLRAAAAELVARAARLADVAAALRATMTDHHYTPDVHDAGAELSFHGGTR